MHKNKLLKALQRAQTHLQAGELVLAGRDLERAVAKFPKSTDAWFMLGRIHGMQHNHRGACDAFAHVIGLNPQLPEAHYNFGLSLRNLGRLGEARQAFEKAGHLHPNYTAAWYNLGVTLIDLDRFEEGEQALLKTLALAPSEQIYMALGIAAQGALHYARAIEYYLESIKLGNRSASVYLNLGTACYSNHDYENGLAYSLEAYKLDPADSIAIHNVADCYLELGEIQQALEFYKLSSYPPDESAYLYALNFLEDYDPEFVFREHKKWGDLATTRAHQPTLPERDLSLDRTLNIAYLSADFRQHPVNIFLEKVLERHNHGQFNIYCYSDVRSPDDMTSRLKTSADHWREIHHLGDQDVSQMILDDNIDILIDLGGHTGERSHLMAMRNAPIQVNYLGHVNTTGLSTVDYRMTDELLDPPGQTDQFYIEKLIRLGKNFYTYTPPALDVTVGPLPALKNGHLTFGSFNKLYKLNQKTIALWSGVMREIPDSRLIMVGRAVSSDSGKARVIRQFERNGISPERLEFIRYLPLQDYLEIHNRVDLVLDCFPWNGHTTTLQSIWMGVPTMTIEGNHHAGRFGYAIMHNLDLPEFIAKDEDEFAKRVIEISHNPGYLASLRLSLRDRLMNSVLCDHDRLVRSIETNYRKMWQNWLSANITPDKDTE